MWSRRRGDSDEPAPRIKGCRRVRRHPGTGDDRSRQPPRLSWISVCTTWIWLSMMSRCALAWLPWSPPGRPDTTVLATNVLAVVRRASMSAWLSDSAPAMSSFRLWICDEVRVSPWLSAWSISASMLGLLPKDAFRSFATSPLSVPPPGTTRSEEHTSELQSLMRISYAVFCLKKKHFSSFYLFFFFFFYFFLLSFSFLLFFFFFL